MKKHFLCLTFILVSGLSSPGAPPSSSYAFTQDESRNYVLKYCRQYHPNDPVARSTFEKAMDGDFNAILALFTDERFMIPDSNLYKVPWHILNVVGDARYARLVRSHPNEKNFLLMVSPGGVPYSKIDASQEYFRKHFPRTYALLEKESRPPAELPGFDYEVRHLSNALRPDPRFLNVIIYRRKDGTTLVTAPKSLSTRDRADLNALVKKYVREKVKVVFE